MSSEEEYVPNNGSSPFEILGLLVVEPSLSVVVELTHHLLVVLNCSFLARLFRSDSECQWSFIVQTVFTTTLFLLSSTLWCDNLSTVLATIWTTIIFLVAVLWRCRGEDFLKWNDLLDTEIHFKNGRLPHLEDFRGHLLHMTAISILAVDFDVFPVRYAKTDTYGWSVMDAGVGLFVGAHSLCSRQARRKSKERLRKSLLSSLPLLALGFARLFAVTAVDYHSSISEYGVHWNFFFTLALTKMICALLGTCFRCMDSGVMALLVLLFHQRLLSWCGITEYIIREERQGLVDANKEGICSLLGFVGIFFAAVKLGQFLWKPRSTLRDYVRLWQTLVALWLSSWLVSVALHLYVQPVSRRMANLPYCVWTMSLMCLHVAIHVMYHVFLHAFRKSMSGVKNKPAFVFASSALWRSTNYNGLFYFLLANVLTGIVNLSMDTGEASPGLSFFILSCYVAILTAAAKVTYDCSIQPKFW